MEFLDIVDENDNVIGKGTRDSVHKSFQIHRGVHVLIINKNKFSSSLQTGTKMY